MQSNQSSIAIDLGASSARFAVGWMEGGEVRYEVIRQVAHQPKRINGRDTWDLNALLEFCNGAVDYAEANFEKATVGIDTWGVDCGFLGEDGRLLQPVVCYRDESHRMQFERMAAHRRRLYELTGIQHQPFNTVYQIAARIRETPDLQKRTHKWLLLPSLLGTLLGVDTPNEFTHASTTQLMGLDSRWCEEAFAICGWRPPDEQPQMPGKVLGKLRENVYLVSVGSHDTASAVHGLGGLSGGQAFLNVGTWALLGCMMDAPLVSREAEDAGFSNERAVDGRVRFLCNVAGFYVINRLHEELNVVVSIPEWLSSARFDIEERVDLMDERFFHPASMAEVFSNALGFMPSSLEDWGGVALASLVATNVSQLRKLEKVTGRNFSEIRISGGGSLSEPFCDLLQSESGLRITKGPAEATVVGNLLVQLGVINETLDR